MLKQQTIQLDFVVKRDHVSDAFACFSLMVSELIEIVYCKYNSLCKYRLKTVALSLCFGGFLGRCSLGLTYHMNS